MLFIGGLFLLILAVIIFIIILASSKTGKAQGSVENYEVRKRNVDDPWNNPWTDEDEEDVQRLLRKDPRLLNPEELKLIDRAMYEDIYGEDKADEFLDSYDL